MVAFRIGDVQVASLDDSAYAAVLEAAAQDGGGARYPILFSLPGAADEVEPLAVVEELARLAGTPAGQPVGLLIATLRDDLMEAVTAADEG
ncbi:MAG: hypothetical protein IT306_29730 [Chloroflexi bacterium]|nr:hypothetical protein [Chloroflexota bacterium]